MKETPDGKINFAFRYVNRKMGEGKRRVIKGWKESSNAVEEGGGRGGGRRETKREEEEAEDKHYHPNISRECKIPGSIIQFIPTCINTYIKELHILFKVLTLY